MNIVVIGGAGGIGLGIVKGFIKRYPSANIYASFHSHVPSYSNARLSWHKSDDLEIISWLRKSGIKVKVICDPDQSIYGFRGG